VVLSYKVDRLTRAPSDFARIGVCILFRRVLDAAR
jgi:hypothetical protein